MRLSEFLEDNSGGFSATRLAFLLWVIGLLVMWMMSSAKTGTLTDIPDTITLLGILMGGKAVQRFGERGETATTTEAVEAAANAGAAHPAPNAQPQPA